MDGLHADVTHPINTVKDKNHVTLSDAERAFDQMQYPLLIKALKNLRRKLLQNKCHVWKAHGHPPTRWPD